MFFNSATRHLFETLRIDLENCETASVVKLEREDEGRTNEEIVQELLLAENAFDDFDFSDEEEELDQGRVTGDELILEQNIKVENTDDDDLHVKLPREQQDLSDTVMLSNESIISPLQSDLNKVFDKFMENFLTRDHNKMDENISEKEEEDRETSRDEEPESDKRTTDNNSTDDRSDIQKQKLQEVEELLTRENRVWKCKECNKSFQTKKNSRLHAELHVKGLKYSCNQCEQIFPARSKLGTHKHKYHRLNVEKDAGGDIGDLYQQKLKKEVEQLLIEDSGRWKCKNCNKTFTKRITLVYHAESHVSGLAFPCKRCTETFTSRLKLHRHKHENHKDRKEDATIEEATERQNIHNEKLKEVEKLLIQIGKGAGWKCKVCGHVFPKKSQLRNHAETHVNGLSYQCLCCSEIRPNKSSLKRHIRVMHRDKSESGVSDSTELIPGDINREINEKIQDLVGQRSDTEWGCLKCFKTFTRKSNLLNHLETHLNYSHSCPECNFNTAVRSALKIHHRVTHQNKK